MGLELSRKFIADGYHVFWVALEEDELARAKAELIGRHPDASIEVLALDLSLDGAQEKVFTWFYGLADHLNVLVNNAGFGVFGYATQTDLGRERSMLHLNVINSFVLTKLFLAKMTARQSGTIINICSNSAFQPVAKLAAYAASKSFLASYSEALHEELRQQNSGVRVLTAYPAAIRDTAFKVRASMESVRTFDGLMTTTKQEVADDIWKAFQQNKSRILTGARHRRLHGLRRVLPALVVRWLVALELRDG